MRHLQKERVIERQIAQQNEAIERTHRSVYIHSHLTMFECIHTIRTHRHQVEMFNMKAKFLKKLQKGGMSVSSDAPALSFITAEEKPKVTEGALVPSSSPV